MTNNLREVNIYELQPSEISLNDRSIEFYSETFPLLRDNDYPEIWELDGEMVISDGHNQLYDRLQRGKSRMFVNYFTRENCGVGKSVYDYIIDELRNCVAQAKKRGIRRITDLIYSK
ncbi:MAG: hypothetical protein AABX16_00300 [Nanoarchaeota archaeon]